MLSMYDPEAEDMSPEANLRKAIRLTAQTGTLVTAFDRIRKGKEPLAPRADLGHALLGHEARDQHGRVGEIQLLDHVILVDGLDAEVAALVVVEDAGEDAGPAPEPGSIVSANVHGRGVRVRTPEDHDWRSLAVGEQVTERVLQRLTDRVVREAVAEIVSAIAERLVREEIERIKSAID